MGRSLIKAMSWHKWHHDYDRRYDGDYHFSHHDPKTGGCVDDKYFLRINKAQTEANPVGPGDTVHYTLTVTNDDTGTAPKGFYVVDAVPSLLKVNSASGTGFDCSVDTGLNQVECTATAELAAGASRTITVTTTVDASAANADPVVNRACLDSSDDDKSEAAGCDSVQTTFKTAVLSLNKTNDPTESTTLQGFNTEVTYTITASASGELDQSNVVVRDVLPGFDAEVTGSAKANLADGLNSVVCKDADSNVIASCATYSDITHTVTATLGSIPTGKSATVTITVKIPAQAVSPLPKTIYVKNRALANSDSTGDGPSKSVKSPTVVNPVYIQESDGRTIPDCEKGVPTFDVFGDGKFTEGETVQMDIYDKDNNLVFADYQPSDQGSPISAVADEFGNATFTGVLWPGYSSSGGTTTYPTPNLTTIYVVLHAVGGAPTLSLGGGMQMSLVPVGSGHYSDPIQLDYPTEDRSCTPVVLDIAKVNDPTSSTTITKFGAEITYTMTVTASEDNFVTARAVTVNDVLPGYGTDTSGTVSYVPGSATCDANIADLGADSFCDTSFASNKVTWELGAMRPGDTRQVSFTVTVDTQNVDSNPAAFTIVNKATVESADSDPVDSNKVENPVSVPISTGISISKKASVSVANPSKKWFSTVVRARGQVVTYRYKVTNTGTLPINQIKLTDDLNFGPTYGTSALNSLDENDLFNCRVGGDDTSSAPDYGATQTFTLGQNIGNTTPVTLNAGESLWLYCDLVVPASLTDQQIESNAIFDEAAVSGSTLKGAVNAQSFVVTVQVTPVESAIVPFKAITDEDGYNYRKFDDLGRLEVTTPKTYRMFVDNVSTVPQHVVVYDYFDNTSKGLSKTARDAIFNSMVCINYNQGAGAFPDPLTPGSTPGVNDAAFTGGSQDTTFAADIQGKHAGTWLARTQDLGIIQPEDGWNFACQAQLPPGEYELTNIFRVISTPVLAPDSARKSGRISMASVPAATGNQDVQSSAGVRLGTPVNEGGGTGGAVDEQTAASPLARTGAD
ncbi:MAG TPA: hypothetical protein DHW34_04750, partial [Actinobacteria bacterium]|nr:hypothetical protein [Actinomycetota bacterium]